MKDILDLLPEKELAIIENAGYALLHKHGYKVRGARRDGRVRANLPECCKRKIKDMADLHDVMVG